MDSEQGFERDIELESSDAEGVKGGGISVNLGDLGSVTAGGGRLDAQVGNIKVGTGESGYNAQAGNTSGVRASGDYKKVPKARNLRRKKK